MMIRINKPDYDQNEVVENCITNMRKDERLKRILSSQDSIVLGSAEYDILAKGEQLSSIMVHDIVVGGVTKDDMTWLYDNKFAKEGQGGRKYYDAIKLLPPFGTCPYCGQRKVSTLDHYLPKAMYPTYAIATNNLVASCYECNRVKGSPEILKRSDETIHPYYDDFNDGVWIKAKVIEKEPIGFEFYVDKPVNWNDEKFTRAQNHFTTFKLNQLYISHASELYSEYLYKLKELYNTGKDSLVKYDIIDRIKEARRLRLNTWKAAMYTALLDSQWFLNLYLPKQSKKPIDNDGF